MKKAVALLLVALVGLAAGTHLYWQNGTTAHSGVLLVSGNIEVTTAEISFKIPGRVLERLVDEGEQVRAGQLVARLDASDLAQEVALRQADVAAAQATLAELEAGSRPEEITEGEAVVERMRAELRRMRDDYERLKNLYEKDHLALSTREYDAARTAYEVAMRTLRESQQRLILLKKGPRREKIDQARAQLQRAKEALALAKIQLGYATLVSPLNGMVLSKNIEPGEYVAAGTPIVTVGDLEHPWLRAYIDETDLGRVKLGQQAQVTTDTYPGKTYNGRLSFIASQAEFTPKSVQTQKERVKLVYRVKIEIANPKNELKPGMPADATILLSPGSEGADGRR